MPWHQCHDERRSHFRSDPTIISERHCGGPCRSTGLRDFYCIDDTSEYRLGRFGNVQSLPSSDWLELALLMVIVDVHFWPIFEGQCSSTGDVVVVPDMQIWEARG